MLRGGTQIRKSVFVNKLLSPLLQDCEHLNIGKAYYQIKNNREIVTIIFITNRRSMDIDVTGDSLLAIVKDVINKFI